MSHKPVARLQVDTRSWGPVFCGKCDSEQEEVIMSSDADFHCPDCGAVIADFDHVANLFTSAKAAAASTPLKKS